MSEELQSIILGTRGSALALAQAEMTEAALQKVAPDLGIARKIIKTTGDRRTDVPLSEVASAEGHLDKGVFIKELELALAAGEIDVAVHSLKDMPSVLEEGFEIAAVLPRAPVGDVLLTKSPGGLMALPAGASVATSSVRRQCMLMDVRPDLEVVDIRGNVPTRIRKLRESEDLDGLLLAEAGLRRLGLLQGEVVRSEGQTCAAERLDMRFFLPAAGQGAVALEIRSGDVTVRELLRKVNDAETFDAVKAERKFLELLGAGCETPVGVLSRIDRDHLFLRAIVFEEGEAEPLVAEIAGLRADPDRVAKGLVEGLTRRQS